MPVSATNVTTTGVVYAGRCRYFGCTLTSTAGATVTIYDGTGAAGTVLASFVLAANGLQHHDLSQGVVVNNGIYLATSATLSGHVRTG